MQMPSFNYCSLDSTKNEIRLLTYMPQLFTASPTDLFSVHRVSLDQKPDFVALSYTWGSKRPPIQIYISNDTQAGEGLISITRKPCTRAS